jgi:citrate synthase
MPKDTLTITDNRTGKTYEVPIENGCIRTNNLRQIKVSEEDFGLMGYDPAFLNTANCKSAITFIDGDKGILEYRGYPIEQLAEKSSYIEVAYLLLNGELPTPKQLEEFNYLVTHHTYVHENIKSFMDGFRYDAHPMSMLASTVAALSGFYPDAKNTKDARSRSIQITRLIAKMPTIAAFSYRHSMGLPYVYPDNELSYVGNFLAMLKKVGTTTYKVHPTLERALDILCHPARRPRAELLDDVGAHGGLLRSGSLLGGGRRASRPSTARCTAAPTRRCCACCVRSATCRRCRTSSRR